MWAWVPGTRLYRRGLWLVASAYDQFYAFYFPTFKPVYIFLIITAGIHASFNTNIRIITRRILHAYSCSSFRIYSSEAAALIILFHLDGVH